jgi:Ca2+-transporting ATPase
MEKISQTQQEFTFEFKGLVAFYDPPKKNSHLVLQHFYKVLELK